MIIWVISAIPALYIIGGVISTVADQLFGKINSKIHLED